MQLFEQKGYLETALRRPEVLLLPLPRDGDIARLLSGAPAFMTL